MALPDKHKVTIMGPVEVRVTEDETPSDLRFRHAALACAVVSVPGSNPEHIISVARVFEGYLRGDGAATGPTD